MVDVGSARRSLVDADDRVDRSEPGEPWWRYRRPEVAPAASASHAPRHLQSDEETPDAEATPVTRSHGAPASGAYAAVLIPGAFVAVAASTRSGFEHLGLVVWPLMAVMGAIAFGNRCKRLRPDEPWLPRLILLGILVKLAAVVVRYVTFDVLYNRVGDAYVYDREGREIVEYWNGLRMVDPLEARGLTGSNFMRWLSGVVYYVFGQDLLAAFLLFGVIAFVGTYFWYRAFADAVPFADKRLFLFLMVIMPSVVFWPGSLGKEALMQCSLGALAWATSLILRGRVLVALPLIAGGGFLTWVIRPHLLALATVASAVPIFVGRMRKGQERAVTARPAVMVLVGVALLFTLTSGLKFVGVEKFSLDSVEERLDYQTRQTSYGGSSFHHPNFSVTHPLFLPFGFVTVVFRPFPYEANGLLPALASLESAALITLIIARFASIRTAFRSARLQPFLLYAIMLIVVYSATLSSLANFGLISRQRSLVLPAVYALICVVPRPRPRPQSGDQSGAEELVYATAVLPGVIERTLGNGDSHDDWRHPPAVHPGNDPRRPGYRAALPVDRRQPRR